MKRPTWDQRIARAEELGEMYPFASEVLAFYASTARFQKALYGYIRQAREEAPLPGHTFHDSLDLKLLLPRFPGFLNVIKEAGPSALAALAEQIAAEKEARWEERLRGFWLRSAPGEMPYIESFFPRAFLQPYAEHIAEKLPEPVRHINSAICPVCDSEPVVGVLREEQLGAKRSFICSFCAQEWDFPRLICPGCREDRNEALAVFTSEYFDHIRVEACDTCKTYVKSVDLTRHGLAIPVVDELAAIPLTIWAQEHGYTKPQSNLMAV